MCSLSFSFILPALSVSLLSWPIFIKVANEFHWNSFEWWVYCSNKLCVYAAGYYPPMAALDVAKPPSSQDVIFISRPGFPWPAAFSLSCLSFFVPFILKFILCSASYPSSAWGEWKHFWMKGIQQMLLILHILNRIFRRPLSVYQWISWIHPKEIQQGNIENKFQIFGEQQSGTQFCQIIFY